MLALFHAYYEPKGEKVHAENTWYMQSSLIWHYQTIVLRNSEYGNSISDSKTILFTVMILYKWFCQKVILLCESKANVVISPHFENFNKDCHFLFL